MGQGCQGINQDLIYYFGNGKRLILLVLNEAYSSTKHRLCSISYNDSVANIVIESKMLAKNGGVADVCGACLMIIEIDSEIPSFDSVEVTRIKKN